MKLSFDHLPSAVAELLDKIDELTKKIDQIQANQPCNELPIDSKELCKRLKISRPTEIRMRKNGKLPFLLVNGHYRYNWQDVMKKLSK